MAARLVAFVAPLGLAALVALAPGCPDTAGRLDRFVEESEPLRVAPLTAECDVPTDMSGDYLIGVGAVIRPDTPILFKGAVTVDLGANTIEIAMRVLDTATRDEIGAVFTATSALDADGGFALDFGLVDVPAAGNPILPGVDVAAELVLSGCTASETFSCGAADGTVVVPTAVPLAGSSWAMIRLEPGDGLASLTPVTACPE